jgi:non-catalytic primase subunit PriX-like protein
MTSINRTLYPEVISDNVDFILSHFQGPIFPRKIMTKGLGYQKEVFSKQEVLNYFETSNYEDCRINAYPSFTNYHGINRVAPSFVMIDIDLRDFDNSREKLDNGLNKILRKISTSMYGYPTVLWTGNGYHIYQPVSGFILEEEQVFAKFIDPNGRDLTTKFMQFAEDYLTNKKGDRQHRPSINSCLVRIPGTTNSKCGQMVSIMQRWDGLRPAINYLLRDFRRWLIDEKLMQSRHSKVARPQTTNSTTIRWIEKILLTPLDDYRKFVVWRILAPYLVNIKKCSADETYTTIRNWLDKCGQLRVLDFHPNNVIKYNINSAKRGGYLPISLEKLKKAHTCIMC